MPVGHPVEPVDQLVDHLRERLDQRDARDRTRCGRSSPGSAAAPGAWRRRPGPGSGGRRDWVRAASSRHRAPGCAVTARRRRLVGDDVEREDQVARVVDAPDLVARCRCRAMPASTASKLTRTSSDVDARLPALQRRPHVVGDLPGGRRVGRRRRRGRGSGSRTPGASAARPARCRGSAGSPRSISRSRVTSAIPPVASVPSGNAQPGADEVGRVIASASDQHGRRAHDDRRAAGGHVAHPGGRQPADEHGRAARRHDRRRRVHGGRRERADVRRADGRRGHAADEHGRHAGRADDPRVPGRVADRALLVASASSSVS